MGRLERFEDLIAWQKARTLTVAVYQATRRAAFGRDHALSGQMQRASVSMMSNIAEGFERATSAEFHQFLWIAKGSCAELRSQLYVAYDVGYLNQAEFDALMRQAEDVARIIGALRVAIQKRRDSRRSEP